MTEPDDDLPILPYGQSNPTSGHSGSDTSAERVADRDSSGKTANTQSRLLAFLAAAGIDGHTVAEARQAMPEHHGTISGSLSNLHKAGKIARLALTRNNCKIYVLPNEVHGRKTEAQGRK